jgi:prefoldin beta subunit
VQRRDNCIKELAAVVEPCAKAYKAIGTLLIESKAPEIKKELHERKETFSTRIETLKKQEDKLRKRADELQKKLETALAKAK